MLKNSLRGSHWQSEQQFQEITKNMLLRRRQISANNFKFEYPGKTSNQIAKEHPLYQYRHQESNKSSHEC